MSAKLVYDPEGDHGCPLVTCSIENCEWGWSDARDLNAAMALWLVHARTTHTFESELEAARRETEALRLETEALRADTERLRDLLRQAGLSSWTR